MKTRKAILRLALALLLVSPALGAFAQEASRLNLSC